MSDDKYPTSIQNLFKPKLPFKYVEPNDYPPQLRKTSNITPITNYKSYIYDYVKNISTIEEENKNKIKKLRPKQQKIRSHNQLKINANLKKQEKEENLQRQIKQWNDPEYLKTLEENGTFTKDPYKTVFLGRLPYEIENGSELTKYFEKYGPVENIKIIKDLDGKPRGYGFLIFNSEYDAKSCVSDLCKTGLKLNNGKKVLIDFERSRIMRNFNPRRLGGDEGGRGYTRTGKYSSVASTGRRMNIANNPNIQIPPKRSYQNNNSHHNSHHQQQQMTSHLRHSNPPHNGISNIPTGPTSMRDKYAKYSSVSSSNGKLPTGPSAALNTNGKLPTGPSYKSQSSDRSMRSIRRGD
ncbi:unnamed protein product [Candida verbasci]|uniref:RRM domain-containing protein n=1 Tax=Candida verbasci TaxID=1227364 RepID=A0A9W4TWI9_9ASCO|nr:unnamed protein product [Candida verbasci]